MRRLICLLAAFCGLIAFLTVPSSVFTSASASTSKSSSKSASAKGTPVSGDTGAIAKSAGQKWALKSMSTGKYVSVEMNDTGKYEWRLRARATRVGKWEQFTLHTNQGAKTASLRSAATGFFATAEFSDAGDRKGMLRARGVRLDTWQQFTPHFTSMGKDGYLATFRPANRKHKNEYVGVNDDGTVASKAAAPGTWSQFALVPVKTPSNHTEDPPAPRAAAAGGLNVMTWNVCASNKNCMWTNHQAGYKELNSQIKGRLKDPKGGKLPDVVFFQEFCEKHAKRVEQMLEGATGRGWDVRFAPIHQRRGGPSLQKECNMAGPGHLDRGAYGVALAVPDDNAWYQRFDFTSPSDKEQRTGLCAALPSRAVMACTGHLSAGKGFDDPSGDVRRKQAVELRDLAAGWEKRGYRPVFGGDMNLVPPYPDATPDEGGPSDALNPVYDRYLECAQKGPDAQRTGPATANSKGGKPTMKLDYIFGPKSSKFSRCSVSATSGLSDHWTLYGSLSLPAT